MNLWILSPQGTCPLVIKTIPLLPSNLTSQVPTKKNPFITGSPVIWSKRCASMLLERFLRRSAEPCKMGSRRTWSSAVFRWILCFVLEKAKDVLGGFSHIFRLESRAILEKTPGNCSFGFWKHWAEWLWGLQLQKQKAVWFLRLTTQAK